MKKSLLIALLLIPFLGFSQTTKPIDGFLGIKFGTSRADVIIAIKAKGGVLLDQSTQDRLIFTGISLGSRSTYYFEADMVNDKAYQGTFVFKPENDPAALTDFSSLSADISEIYGKGKAYRIFKSPYKDGDDDEISAIRGGYATINTSWGKDKDNSISLYITNKLTIMLSYQDAALSAEATAKQKTNAKSDL